MRIDVENLEARGLSRNIPLASQGQIAKPIGDAYMKSISSWLARELHQVIRFGAEL